MDNIESVSGAFKDFRERIKDLIKFYDKDLINLETLELNLNEDLNDLEDTVKILMSK